MSQLEEYHRFMDMGRCDKSPAVYKKIWVHLIIMRKTMGVAKHVLYLWTPQ